MIEYILIMFSLLPEKMQHNIKKGKITPASENLLKLNKDSPVVLSEKDRVLVHSSTAWLLFLGKRACPDVQTPVD